MLLKLYDLRQSLLEYLLREAHLAGFRRISFPTIEMILRMGTEAHLVGSLAEQLHVTQQATGKTLRRMRDTGYVEAATVEEDGRRHRQQLTGRGLELLAVLLAAEARVSMPEKLKKKAIVILDTQLDLIVNRPTGKPPKI